MRGDQLIETLNYQQQKKMLKPCETYKQSYNAKLKSALDNPPRTTTECTREIKELAAAALHSVEEVLQSPNAF
nr:heme peroxidase [Tanacetum cinerariifolium]